MEQHPQKAKMFGRKRRAWQRRHVRYELERYKENGDPQRAQMTPMKNKTDESAFSRMRQPGKPLVEHLCSLSASSADKRFIRVIRVIRG
jgi:hypothetical protein